MRAGPCWFRLVPSFSAVFYSKPTSQIIQLVFLGPSDVDAVIRWWALKSTRRFVYLPVICVWWKNEWIQKFILVLLFSNRWMPKIIFEIKIKWMSPCCPTVLSVTDTKPESWLTSWELTRLLCKQQTAGWSQTSPETQENKAEWCYNNAS